MAVPRMTGCQLNPDRIGNHGFPDERRAGADDRRKTPIEAHRDGVGPTLPA